MCEILRQTPDLEGFVSSEQLGGIRILILLHTNSPQRSEERSCEEKRRLSGDLCASAGAKAL